MRITIIFFLALASLGPHLSGQVEVDTNDPHRFTKGGFPWYLVGYTPGLGALTLRQDDNLSRVTYYEFLHSFLDERNISSYRTIFSMGQSYNGTFVAPKDETLPYCRVNERNTVSNKGNPICLNINKPPTGQENCSTYGTEEECFDIYSFRNSHFDYWNDVLSHAASKNLVVQINIFDNWHLNNETRRDSSRSPDGWGYFYDFYYNLNNVNSLGVTGGYCDIDSWHAIENNSLNTEAPVYKAQQALVDQVARKLGHHLNVIWEIGNEPGGSENCTGGQEDRYYGLWAGPLANYLKARLNTLHGGHTHVVIPVDSPDHQHTPAQKTGSNAALSHSDLADDFYRNLPLIAHNDTMNWELTADQQREKVWASLTAGAHMDYFFPKEDKVTLVSNSQGATYLGYASDFLERNSADLTRMIGCDDSVFARKVGNLPSDHVANAAWAYCRTSSEYIIYKRPNLNSHHVHVVGLPANYTAAWYDPRNGTNEIGATEAGRDSFSAWFTPPSSRKKDWVLYINVGDSVELLPTDDTFTTDYFPNTNFGGATELKMFTGHATGSTKTITWLRFDPKSTDIPYEYTNVKLRVEFGDIDPVFFHLKKMLYSNWSEYTATYANYNNYVIYSQSYFPQPQNIMEFDVTNLVTLDEPVTFTFTSFGPFVFEDMSYIYSKESTGYSKPVLIFVK